MVSAFFVLKIAEWDAPAINHFYLDSEAGPTVRSCFYVWCITTGSDIVIVDQGFTGGTVERMLTGPRKVLDPHELLRLIDIEPDQVTAVILTHLHWDHAAMETVFPRATYYLQRAEFKYATGDQMDYEILRRFYDVASVEKFRQLHAAGRVCLVDGTQQVFPGIEVVHVGGHTPGSQAVVYRHVGTPYVICGDVVPQYRNLDGRIPCGILVDVVEALVAQATLEAIAGSRERLFPGHAREVSENLIESEEGLFIVSR